MKIGKNRYVKVTSISEDNEGEIEWFAIDDSKARAKALADAMGMPSDSREYKDVYLTQEQYEAIPEWQG